MTAPVGIHPPVVHRHHGAYRSVPKVRRRRWRRSLMALDVMGLLLALWACSRYFVDEATRGYIVVLGAVGAFLWAFAISWKQSSPLRRSAFFPVILTPVIASVGTFGLAVALGAPHPTDGTLTFMIVWVVWLASVRLGMGPSSPRLRALVALPSEHWRELAHLPGLELVYMDVPPDDFACDLAVLEPLTQYGPEWQRWFVHADLAGVQIVGGATLVETMTGRISTAELSGHWAPEVFPGDSASAYAPWKRLLDIVVALAALPLVLPLCVGTALAVLIGTGRPILFWQQRVGRAGVPFRMVKFRTMTRPAPGDLPAFAVAQDPRVTRVGAVIRRLRLDELPQFWNVLCGEMSIIGPRPEQLFFAERFADLIPLYDIRHRVRPGISGWAQVTHGYTDDAEATSEKLRRDLYYIKHYSFSTDARIALRTAQTILTGFGSR